MRQTRSLPHAVLSAALVARLRARYGRGVSAARPSTTPPEGAPLEVAGQDPVVADPEDTRCDACGAVLPAIEDDEGYELPGRGVYLWLRGGEVTFEHAPLCASCASAIGMTALARWEIEEEEG